MAGLDETIAKLTKEKKALQGLLVGLLEGLFLLGQLGDGFIQTCHLFCEVFHLWK